MLDNEGDEDEDDNGKLSDLIALAEVGLQAEKDGDNTGRLSELIALAEAGLQAEEDEDAFFSQAIEAAYYRRQTDLSNAGEPSHMNEEWKRTRSCLRPQMKWRPLTSGERQIRAI